MSEHVHKVVDLVGSSTSSIEDAIQTAIRRADQTLRNLRWLGLSEQHFRLAKWSVCRG
jgi:flavin-binding protein dodecin